MTKIITSSQNNDEIILDAALLQQTQIKSGDDVRVQSHPGGGLTIMPSPAETSVPDVSGLIESTMDRYAGTMKRLA
jgi:antitoxin component of MazEF toxin-antitoxin module